MLSLAFVLHSRRFPPQSALSPAYSVFRYESKNGEPSSILIYSSPPTWRGLGARMSPSYPCCFLPLTMQKGVPGDYTLRALDSLEPSGLRWIGNCNELNAGYAADGYGRIRGLAALFTTYGVGELSALNAVAGSYAEYSPVVRLEAAFLDQVTLDTSALREDNWRSDRSFANRSHF